MQLVQALPDTVNRAVQLGIRFLLRGCHRVFLFKIECVEYFKYFFVIHRLNIENISRVHSFRPGHQHELIKLLFACAVPHIYFFNIVVFKVFGDG